VEVRFSDLLMKPKYFANFQKFKIVRIDKTILHHSKMGTRLANAV